MKEEEMEITLDSDAVLQMFYDSFRIPAGIFDRSGKLRKLFYAGGTRQTKMYLADAGSIRDKCAGSGPADPAELLLDGNGSCWCCIPGQDDSILLGPVQTGRNPLFAYEGIPEHTGKGFLNISRYVVSLLYGNGRPLIDKEDAYTEAFAARQMYKKDYSDVELQSFDELFLCVMTGDRTRLDAYLHSGSYLQYLDDVMPDMQTARTVFQFNLAKTYHSAQQSRVPITDLTPLVDMYLSESAGYRSVAAYQSGMLRMLYDFTRYVSQYMDERYSPLVNQAIMRIREHIYTQLSVEDVAAYCMVSISTLQHRFKSETGMSVKEKIRRSKMERACFFLKNTDLSCSDIAYRLGFGSQSYFIKQFRAMTGMTPAEYRK